MKGPDGTGSLDENSVRVASDIVLPSAADATPERMKKLRAFGRIFALLLLFLPSLADTDLILIEVDIISYTLSLF